MAKYLRHELHCQREISCLGPWPFCYRLLDTTGGFSHTGPLPSHIYGSHQVAITSTVCFYFSIACRPCRVRTPIVLVQRILLVEVNLEELALCLTFEVVYLGFRESGIVDLLSTADGTRIKLLEVPGYRWPWRTSILSLLVAVALNGIEYGLKSVQQRFYLLDEEWSAHQR